MNVLWPMAFPSHHQCEKCGRWLTAQEAVLVVSFPEGREGWICDDRCEKGRGDEPS